MPGPAGSNGARQKYEAETLGFIWMTIYPRDAFFEKNFCLSFIFLLLRRTLISLAPKSTTNEPSVDR